MAEAKTSIPWINEETPTTRVVRAPAPGESGLGDRLAEEMASAWARGERPRAEDFLEQEPQLAADPDVVLRVVCEEICLRQEEGEDPPSAELVARFPRYRQEIEALLECHRLLQSPSPPTTLADLPADFRVLAELGRGGNGHVYLATQPALADRPVVLKITPCEGREYWSLARLQHTHIVPLYWVHDEPEKNRRTLCMPYFGDVTLAALLHRLRDRPLGQRQGSHILELLDASREKAAIGLSPAGPARPFLARASYVQAICWMGTCLADALEYAHERGLIHLDIKPSNILLAGDGQPMLLDFHLAQEPLSPSGPAPRGLGGTMDYLSPEQRLALEAVRRGKRIPVPVAGGSDLYSLGLVLYQALGGPVPAPEPMPRLEACNPEVTPGLADIIHRCLAAEPKMRYPNAAALAADLRRHLADLPLRGVLNRSWGERWGKWRRRKPHALTLTALCAFLLAALIGSGSWLWSQNRQRLAAADVALRKGEESLAKEEWSRAVDFLEQGLSLADTTGGGELGKRLSANLAKARVHLRQAERRKSLADLHRLVNQIRLQAYNEALSPAVLGDLQVRCRSLWDARTKLDPAAAPLDPETQRLRLDWLDLAVILADVTVRSESTTSARRQAMQVLSDAEKFCGGSLILYRELARHAREVGDGDVAEIAERQAKDLAPCTAWDHVALSRALLKQKNYQQAAEHLDKALLLDPRDFWANFYQGVCTYRTQQYHAAVRAFQTCIVLSTDAPETAHCYVNRALAETALGEEEHALRDYDQALALDPNLPAALLNRGILHLQRKQYPAALADMSKALASGADPAATHFNLARVYLAQKNSAEATLHLRQALQATPDHREATELLRRLEKKSG